MRNEMGKSVAPLLQASGPVYPLEEEDHRNSGLANPGAAGEHRPIRFRDISHLHPRTVAELAFRAAEASLERLKSIHQNSDPLDRPLRRLTGRIISGKEDQVQFLEQLESTMGLDFHPRLSGLCLEMTFREHFISHSCPFGEGYLNRESTMYFIESTTQELSRFFSILSSGTWDQVLSSLLRDAAEAEESLLSFVRSVILEDRDREASRRSEATPAGSDEGPPEP